MKLNQDQQEGCAFIRNWWTGPEQIAVIHGKAGTGKTFMTWEAIRRLPGCSPLMTAPTNAAVKQLHNSVGKDSGLEFKTTYSAFNIAFSFSSEKPELKQWKTPEFNNNMLVVDEGSFLGDSKQIQVQTMRVSLFSLIKASGLKTLILGHRSQLPEVQEGQLISAWDKCESIVFQQGYPTFNLTIPMRAQGELQKAHDYLESLIYQERPIFKNEWSRSKAELAAYVRSVKGKIELMEGSAVFLCYTNRLVDASNEYIRQAIFREDNLAPFTKGDRLLLTKPLRHAGHLVSSLKAHRLVSLETQLIEANTNLVVKGVNETTIAELACWEIVVESEEHEGLFLYVPKSKQDWHDFKEKKRIAVFASKAKDWESYHNLLGMFAEVKHSYTRTIHRAQGTTIPKVILSWEDIKKCQNQVLRYKLLYTGGSRSSEELIIRG